MVKKVFLIGGLIVLFSTLGHTQQSRVDSLRNSLVSTEKDTNKINMLLELGTLVSSANPNEAIIYNQEAIDLSEQLDFPKGKALALKNIGLAYYFKSNFPEVENYWQQSLATYRAINDQLGVSNLLSNLGAVYFGQGNYPKALEFYFESLRASENQGDKFGIARALTNIGAVYFENPNDYDKAREFYIKALPISEETNNPELIGTCAVNLGEIYITKEQPDSALFYFQKALKAHDNQGVYAAYALYNIGRVYATQGKYKEAIKFQNQAFEEAERIESKQAMAQSLNGLGNSYLELARQKEGQADYSKALTFFKTALGYAQNIAIKREIEISAKGLYEIYKAQGNYEEALKYHETYNVVSDSILNEQNIKKVALLGAEYDFDKEKQQIKYELDAKIRRQREVQLATAGGLIIALIFIGILVQYYRLKRLREAEKFEAQRQLIVQDKLATLGQITAGIAHEIKNPLNFVTNFAEGSVELGDELMEVMEENKDNIPEEQFNLIQEIIDDLNQNSKTIQESGLRADRVVKRMMEQARGDKGDPQQIDINTLVDENINLAYHGFRGNTRGFDVAIEKDFDNALPPVLVIPQDIGRVVLNIFNNACYALNEKQKKVDTFHPIISVSTGTQNGHVIIRMRDNGPGIPEKIRKEIFDPFFTTKPTGTGNTGLGLSISHDLIVIGHNGKLEVESKMGEFTEFVISLPAV